MEYKIYMPNEHLKSYIKYYWTLDSSILENSEKQRIVPDGCIEMVFHYGDLYKQYINIDKAIVQPRSFVFGQITLPLNIEPTGDTGIFAIRFNPGGFSPFSPIPLQILENKATSLEDIYGNEGQIIENEILDSKSTESRIKIIESFLINRLNKKKAIDDAIKLCLESLFYSKGQISINKLSEELKINRRNLERKFSSKIGLSPKQLSKIIRLHATLKLLDNMHDTSLTLIAQEGNFYDQAHFIKDFKEFTGISPKKYYADNLKMSNVFFNTD